MSDPIPSFRPRSAIGFTQSDGKVSASPEFVRWLDTLRRQADGGAGAQTAALGLPSGSYALPRGQSASDTPAAQYATPSSPEIVAQYSAGCGDTLYAEYG